MAHTETARGKESELQRCTLKTPESVFTNHSQEHTLSFSLVFRKFLSNKTPDWSIRSCVILILEEKKY